jgi:Flp pilus assembly protein TadD
VETELPDRAFWNLLVEAMSFGNGRKSAEESAALDEAVRLRPEALLPRLGRGILFLRTGDAGAAVRELEAAAVLPSVDARADALLGAAYLAAGEEVKAETVLLRAVAAEPDYALPRQVLSDLYGRRRKDTAKALPHLEKLVEIEPQNGLYQFEKGSALREVGREDEALESFLAAAVAGTTPESLSQAAYIYLKRKDYENAKPLLERYLKAAESDAGKNWARGVLERLEKELEARND